MIEELVGRHGRLLEPGPHGFECRQGLCLVDAELVDDEPIGMLNLEVVGESTRPESATG